MSGCLIAASRICVKIASCSATTLTGVRLSADQSTTPTDLLIADKDGYGFAAGILSTTRHVPASVFPATWTYIGGG
jgi:hypothetical protein